MALVIVQTNEGELIGTITLTNASGPWTDEWQGGDEHEFADLVNEALTLEGDVA